MENKQFWKNKKNKKNTNQIPNNMSTDILIIGGGITGLTCAYFLKDSDKKITIIDSSQIGMGVTSKSTAKITYLQEIIYQKLIKSFDYDVAKLYYHSQIDAINIIKKIILKNNIKCDFNQADSIIFTLETKNIKKIEKEKSILESFNVKVSNINHEKIEKGIKITDSYVFNPVKYLEGISNNLKDNITIYEHVLANKIEKKDNKYLVTTNKSIITANTVIVSCHYPFFLIPNMIPLKTYIKREYVNASPTDKIENYTAISIDNKLHSIRFHKNYLIYASNKQRLTSKIDYKKNYDKSKKDYKKYFKKEPIYTWMNQDIISNDNLPFIGKIDDNLYIGTSYNAWGMTNGTIAGYIIADIILKKKNKYIKIFNPKRKNKKLLFNSLLGSIHYIKGYVNSIFYKKNPYYIKKDGLTYAIYKDKQNKKHIIKLICPHMKCHLIFNREEETWDCPCHGSRFDIDGNVIEGPASKNIKKISNT